MQSWFYYLVFDPLFLGANAPLGPALSEALYVCMYVCNILTPLPFSPLPLPSPPGDRPCLYKIPIVIHIGGHQSTRQ